MRKQKNTESRYAERDRDALPRRLGFRERKKKRLGFKPKEGGKVSDSVGR